MSLQARLEAWLLWRWYSPRVIRPLLPLAWLYRGLIGLRRTLYASGVFRSYRSTLPVLVVGNLNVGGAGKTPLVLALIDALRARGWRPGVISRGHGGSARAPMRLPATPNPTVHGDEPSLIRQRSGAEVAIGRRRADAARLLEDCADVDVLIADDGLQHLALQRDVEILVIDGRRRFGNGALLPAGPLREPASRAAHCDLVVVNGGEALPEEVQMHLRPNGLRRLHDDARVELSELAAARVHAVAGIGDPARFFASLRASGLTPVEHPFPDHHAFEPADFEFSEALPVLMTEKDAVKCRQFAGTDWYALRVDAELPDALFDEIDQRLRLALSRRTSDDR
ncbi:tetraacyldisaccharide 4'-kinase [Aquimonas sp.]|jgi:tetraacyldisaccharide 4'-kinase|uniref:tetraacyldisaccharide 4'-kinase n=1 Tax=Aquimonas sp. TaxID=1872588 RepID=UPI0037C060F9